MVNLITDHIDIWTAAQTQKTNGGRGRGNGSANNSPHGIKKLRELILELAVRGKLVPQDPNDEPASVLLEKIDKEKARLIKADKIKKQKPLPEISEDEKPFDLPLGWEWFRLGDLGNIFNGNSISEMLKEEKYTNIEVGLPFIATKDVGYGWEELDYSNGVSIPEEEPNFKVAHSGAVLICSEGGSAGKKCGITNQDICFGNKLFAIELYGNLESSYILANYLSPTFFYQFSAKMTGIIGGVSTAKFSQLLVPIPPLSEQHRIVAKVDELMALCDQLEQQQTDSSTVHQILVDTLLATLASAADQEKFAEAWQRIANHFNTLFTTEHSIDKLKQTILQLAVMGKLVPQDPNDEPASVLLKKISKEKARLIKEGKIKKQKPLPEISGDEKPFELPKGWEWVTLSHLGVFSGGKTPSKAKNIYWDGDIPWVTPKDMKIAQIFDTEDHVTAMAIDDGLSLYEPEAILFVVRSGILRHSFPVAITKVFCTVNQDLKVLSLYRKKLSLYVYLMMRGFEQYILENLTKTGMTVESVMFEEFSKHYFMLPPLSEQHRIVSKVDELMAICDTLKARLNDAQTTQVQLADAIVELSVA